MKDNFQHLYENPSVTVDVIVFTVKNNDLKVILVKRKYEPFKKMWVIPGGFVRVEESLENAAKRELLEETNVKDVFMEQLYTFGEPKRDPRGRVITVAYFALVGSKKATLKASSDAAEAKWHSVYSLPELGFDHKKIMDYALQRLRYKLEYTTAAFQFLPEMFTLTELQAVYEIVFNKQLDKRNFRKKILSLGLIEYTGKMKRDVAHRPAKLYSFSKKHTSLENFFKA
jgi:8-oxo-dGTP diphosphatase